MTEHPLFTFDKQINKRSADTYPTKYRGRFAPSPSGSLHFGSLVTALASYLHAKSRQGTWLVRIEDIDPPREQAGAADDILFTLEKFGLYWDEDVLYQSQQAQRYRDILAELVDKQLSYYCGCTRAEIKALDGIYQGKCRYSSLPATNHAMRLINRFGINQFNDLIQGQVICDESLAKEDFIIHRKDGLFAYQLAVVADDAYQGISHVIRGCDLLEPTARQLTLFKTLGINPPLYGHIPLAVTPEGYKLSKQNKAPALNNARPQPSILTALAFLGQHVDQQLVDSSVEEIIQHALKNWDETRIPQTNAKLFIP